MNFEPEPDEYGDAQNYRLTTFVKTAITYILRISRIARSPCITGAFVAALGLAGCALFSIQPGATRVDVLVKYGIPSAKVTLFTGKRLQYSYQPAGQNAWMFDLDSTDTVVSASEVLKLNKSSKLIWVANRSDVQREFGHPAAFDWVTILSGDIMVYRWLGTAAAMLFWVYLDTNDVVQRTGQGLNLPTRRKD